MPYVWADIGGGEGSILFVYNPPGKIEALFDALAKLTNVTPSDAESWCAHDMEYVQPPQQVQADFLDKVGGA